LALFGVGVMPLLLDQDPDFWRRIKDIALQEQFQATVEAFEISVLPETAGGVNRVCTSSLASRRGWPSL